MVRKVIGTEQERLEFIQLLNKQGLDKPLVAEFKCYKKVRSLRQNKLYWLWLRCVSDETGNDVDSLHQYFGNKYLPWSEVQVFDTIQTKILSTTALDTAQFDEYLEQIRMEMLDINIHLPLPEEHGFDEFYLQYSGG